MRVAAMPTKTRAAEQIPQLIRHQPLNDSHTGRLSTPPNETIS
jgi:hypothetical protein